VIPTDTLYSKVFNFSVSEPYNKNFNNLGFGSRNIINNLGSNFIYITVICCAYIIHIILKFT
jgi:hypothetical protein